MKTPALKLIAIGLLTASLATPALAGPPGPSGHGGPGGHSGPGPNWNPGPRHGHGLPDYAREIWIGSALYFLAAGTYYAWNADRKQYIVVEPPVTSSNTLGNYEVIAYPARGQSTDQQGRDRYECHTWAVSQSGFDPARASQAPAAATADYYRRALGACLSGRGYSIN